jgi:DNA-binding NtrC family response regulator
MANILLVDDDDAILAALKLLLKRDQHHLVLAKSPGEALIALKQTAIDLVLMDMNFTHDTTSGGEGLDLISQCQNFNADIPLIVMTGWGSIELAVKCLQQGASDFIEKPWDNERLLNIVRTQASIMEQKRFQAELITENKLLNEQLSAKTTRQIISHSPAMKATLDTIDRVAASDLNIYLSGENGTGKSMLAHYIHQMSHRKDQRMVAINMGAIAETLFESEMFGHVKGAFTDARETRIGRFELANKGTLFLDEIGNIPLSQQAKLLRVLEERQFERLGSSTTITADVRLISASNANIQTMVAEGNFRQDLLYRLNTVEIRVPPLRERREDINELCNQFLEAACIRHRRPQPELTSNAKQLLNHYDWPGNIRELQHVIERSLILCEDGKIDADTLMLQEALHDPKNADNQALYDIYNNSTLDEIEKNIIESRILQQSGNMSKAASSLGLSRSAFYRRLEKLQIR